MKAVYVIADEEVRRRVALAVAVAPIGSAVTIGPKTRSLEANSLMWVILNQFHLQLPWPINGKLETVSAEEYKQIFTAAFYEEDVRLAAGLHGGVVMLGHRTREFDKQQFSDFITFLEATAAEKGVRLDDA